MSFDFFRRKTNGKASGPAWDELPHDELFVAVDPESTDRLLEDWRWKIGDEAEIYQVTVFGDLFTQSAEGTIYWLDTGRGRYVEVADSVERWQRALREHWREWFHWSTLRELRGLDVELAQGYVYSWIQNPMIGGVESVENVDSVPVAVHLSATGQLANTLNDRPSQTPTEKAPSKTFGAGEDSSDPIYQVVVNGELQYSMWPVDREIPAGWKAEGPSGTKPECLEYIQAVWTDMRPLSMRQKLEGE